MRTEKRARFLLLTTLLTGAFGSSGCATQNKETRLISSSESSDPLSANFHVSSVRIVRLLPGTDVRDWIDSWSKENAISAASIVSSVGSLSDASIRFAGEETETLVHGPLEVVSLTGLTSKSGSHLHLSVSDSKGRTLGGHLSRGCKVRTTLELVIAVYEHPGRLELTREQDPRSGYKELFIRPTEPANLK